MIFTSPDFAKSFVSRFPSVLIQDIRGGKVFEHGKKFVMPLQTYILHGGKVVLQAVYERDLQSVNARAKAEKCGISILNGDEPSLKEGFKYSFVTTSLLNDVVETRLEATQPANKNKWVKKFQICPDYIERFHSEIDLDFSLLTSHAFATNEQKSKKFFSLMKGGRVPFIVTAEELEYLETASDDSLEVLIALYKKASGEPLTFVFKEINNLTNF